MPQQVVVVGAGAFGGWTALHLLRRGARVTLIDAWGAGNARAGSGGETRLIRGIYGPDEVFIRWVAASFPQWHALERQTGNRLYVKTGALWLFSTDDGYARASLPHLSDVGLPVRQLSPEEAGRQFPLVRTDDLQSVYLEDEAGYLFARRACRAVVQQFRAEGGTYLQTHVAPGKRDGGRMVHVVTQDGRAIWGDQFVFACGAWLGQMFPEEAGRLLLPTRQEVYYYGLGAGREAFASLPVWMDFGKRVYYGVPGADGRGFKAGDDTRGPEIEPTGADRSPDQDGVAQVRARLHHRFPDIGDLPLLEARVCQYANTTDGRFLIARHPDAANVRLLSGGSGHGFKLGPALGAHVADLMMADQDAAPAFGLDRPGFDAGGMRTQLEG